MRFDQARAVKLADEFDFDRAPWTSGGRRAADRVGEAFEEAGYGVERNEVGGSPSARNLTIVLNALIFGAGLTMASVLRDPGGSIGARLGKVVACVVGSFVVSLGVGILGGRVLRLVRTCNVSARRSGTASGSPRVIFVTALDVSPSVPRSSSRKVATRAYGLAIMMMFILCLAPVPLPLRIHVAVLAVFGVTCGAWLICRVRPFPGEGGDDNRDGLALLLELARSWPRDAEARFETRFVAVGGQLLNGAGLDHLASQMLLDRTPTLLVAVWSPGRSARLTIASPDLAELAREAAESLWVPFHMEEANSVLADLFPARGFTSSVGLIGVPEAGALKTLDAEAIRRAAHLAREIALRWVKRQAPSHEPGASLARSSQNPG